MIRIFFFYVLIVLLISCRDEKKPTDILSPEKMETVIWDVMQSDQFVQGFVRKKYKMDEFPAIHKAWFEKVCSLHKITPAQFDKSLEYYYEQPEIMQNILDSITARHPSESTIGHPISQKDTISRQKRVNDTLRGKMLRNLNKDSVLKVIPFQ